MEKTLVIRANTNSTWDSADVFLVDLEELSKKMLTGMVKPIKDKLCDETRSWYYNFEVKIVDENHLKLKEFMSQYDKHFTIIEGDWDFYNDPLLINPESRLDCESIKVYHLHSTDKSILVFSCYGKHTGEEFWSTYVYFSDIFEHIND